MTNEENSCFGEYPEEECCKATCRDLCEDILECQIVTLEKKEEKMEMVKNDQTTIF